MKANGNGSGSLLIYVVAELQAHRGQWRYIAQETGVSVRTIEKIASGQTRKPGEEKVEALGCHFRALHRAAARRYRALLQG